MTSCPRKQHVLNMKWMFVGDMYKLELLVDSCADTYSAHITVSINTVKSSSFISDAICVNTPLEQ